MPDDESSDDSYEENERREGLDEEEESDAVVNVQESVWDILFSRQLIQLNVFPKSDERAPSPEEKVVLSASNSLQENLGPSEEEDAEFAKELAKLVTDTSTESRKVDKKTALALWDSAVLPPNIRKKRQEDDDESNAPRLKAQDVMNFAVVTKRGNKQQVGLSHDFVSCITLTTI